MRERRKERGREEGRKGERERKKERESVEKTTKSEKFEDMRPKLGTRIPRCYSLPSPQHAQ